MERAGRGIRWPEGHSKRNSKCVVTSGGMARDKEHVQRTALPECEEFIGQEAGMACAGIFIIPQQRPEQQHAHVQHDLPPKAQMRTTPGRITKLNTASNVQACLCRCTQLDYHMRCPGSAAVPAALRSADHRNWWSAAFHRPLPNLHFYPPVGGAYIASFAMCAAPLAENCTRRRYRCQAPAKWT
jgi:hypothetical protein